MIILQAAQASSGLVSAIIMVLLMVSLAFYITKAQRSVKTGFSIIVILTLLGIGVFQHAKYLKNINNSISIFLLLCSCLLIICFLFSVFQIYNISRLAEKTKSNIIRRKVLVGRLGYLVTFATSFFVVGIAFTSLIDSEYSVSVPMWIQNTSKFAFFATMAIVLIDGLISKICSPIYTVEQIKDIDDFNLYLRSFDADNTHKKDEEFICRTFNHLFPTYAIGDPNSLLQPYGADRIYATDDEWQEAVSSLMSKSKLIIVRCGLTNGTLWEIDKIFSTPYVKKSVFIVDNKEILNILLSKISDYGIKITRPELNINNSQFALYLYQLNNNEWGLVVKEFRKESDVESFINEILKLNPHVNKEYSKKIEIRHSSFRIIFSKDIPKSVRQSLNWGILSPLINMRHWPLVYWAIFIGLTIISCLAFKSIIPAYIIVLLPFIVGNRIEWTQIPSSSPEMFLKKQRREATIMWTSMLSTGILAWICIMFVI